MTRQEAYAPLLTSIDQVLRELDKGTKDNTANVIAIELEKLKIELENRMERDIAPAGTGQACSAANACWLKKGHPGFHEDCKGNIW